MNTGKRISERTSRGVVAGSAVGGAKRGRRPAGAPAAASSGAGSDQTPPLTNRGCLPPEGEGPLFHLDYLKLTIFGPFSDVVSLVEQTLLERAGLVIDEWVNKGSAKRWKEIWVGPSPVEILVPRDASANYKILEIKGEGCTAIGAKALSAFLKSLPHCGMRWHGLRVDLAFDHVAFRPMLVDAAIVLGNFNSRCLNVADRDWNDSPTGQTAYLGGRRCKKSRLLRVYNKHGFNRCEGEFRRDWANAVVCSLIEAGLNDWPRIALGYTRGMVDFVDRTSNPRVERCALLPWWSEFIGNVERIKNLPETDRREEVGQRQLHIIGISEDRIIRSARSLWPLIEAFGMDYVRERIWHYALPRITDEDRALAEELKRHQYCGLAGLPGDPPDTDDVPF